MAPLLGRKAFPLAKPLLEPPAEGEELYIIEHTKEAFRNKEEYESRLQKYSERIWTCKSTGSIQLTHKEAWEEEQEVTELLKEEFPVWFEKLVLEIVHHNTVSLDKLVDKAWLEIMTKYAVGEECDFEVGNEKVLRVTVVRIHPLEQCEEECSEKKSNGACDSPSSDKENSSQIAHETQNKENATGEDETRRERMSDRARRSPRKLPTSLKKEEKKWVPPKLLPHKYDVKLVNEDKIISNVPSDSLIRTERPPNKEIMRYFIRHYSLRVGTGENAPWVVEDELVKKYSLPSKFSDFLLDPHKYMALNPTVNTGKRKSSVSPEKKPSKKHKPDDSNKVNVKADDSKKKKPLSPSKSPTIWGHIKTKKSVNGTPLKMKNGTSTSDLDDLEEVIRIVSLSTTKLSTHCHTAKKCSVSGNKVSKEKPKPSKSGEKSSDKSKSKSKDKAKLLNGQKSPGKKEKVKLVNGQKSPGKNKSKIKMKQITLLDMAKSNVKPSKTSKSSAGTEKVITKPKFLPHLALHLINYYKENKDKEEKKGPLSCLIAKVAKILSAEERARLPDELRDLVQKRYELLEHKRKWASMTVEERKEYLKKKREELKEKLKEKAKQRKEKELQEKLEKLKRYEDQDLVGKNLPPLKLVDTPEGLPNTLFGDVAMVAEFLSCYSGLLMPDDQYPVTASALMEALTSERGGFLYMNRILVVLLQTLLQDEIAEDYIELGMRLSEIPLTMHSVSDLVRLCLRRSDAQEDSEASENADESKDTSGFDDNEVQDEFLDKLENTEFFELSPDEKLKILSALCHRILMTYSVQDHVDSMQQKSAELWKERLAMLKGENDRKRAEKLKKKEMEAKIKENVKEENEKLDQKSVEKMESEIVQSDKADQAKSDSENAKPDIKVIDRDESGKSKQDGNRSEGDESEKGKQTSKKKEKSESEKLRSDNKKAESEKGKPESKKTDTEKSKSDVKKGELEKGKNDQTTLDVEDMVTAVKSRRLLALQAKKEKEEQERQLKEKLEKEAEEERQRKQRAAAEKAFHEGIAKAKLVLRRLPIGTDRNHNRYWLFSSVVPGLYIEKGWVLDSIDYNYTLPAEENEEEEDDEGEEDQDSSVKMETESQNDSVNENGPQCAAAQTDTCVETTVPKLGQNLWFLCDTPKELDELIDSLHPQGIRESQLKERLQKRYQDILHSIHLARRQNTSLKSCDGHQELLNYLRSDLIEVTTRLHKGGLGYMDGTSEFEERVRSLESLKDFGECVITLQESVIKKFLQGFMAPKQKKKKLQDDSVVKMEEVDEEKRLAEEAKVATAVEKWKSAIKEAQTFSRMHVLLGMLDACIKWDMSAENARCKVCRKKGEEDKLILCDECNKAFHLFCLRPALYSVPDGEWMCPACQPSTARRGSRGRNYAEESVEEDDEDSEEDSEDEEEYDEEEEEEEEDEFTGIRLRPRKAAKGKKSSRLQKQVKKQKKKKASPQPNRNAKHKTASVNGADVDELVRQSRQGSRRQNPELLKCEEMLNKLIKFRFSWPFREPVTVEDAEDYFDIISNPMDFQTMLNKLTCRNYHSVHEFIDDMKLVFNNAEEYNQTGSQILSCLEKTEQCFVDLLKKHLPNYTYMRRKHRRQTTRRIKEEEEEEEEDEDVDEEEAENEENIQEEEEGMEEDEESVEDDQSNDHSSGHKGRK